MISMLFMRHLPTYLRINLSPPSCVVDMRDAYVDMTRFIGILLMVIGHSYFMYWFGGWWPGRIIWSFHMPPFFIISGYMHKQRELSDVFYHGIKTLVYPYFVFGTIALIISILKHGECLSDALYLLLTANSSPAYNNGRTIGPIWFLLALFWGRFYFTCVLKYFRHFHILASLIVTCLAFSIHEAINPPLGLLTGANALIFISIGYSIREHGLNIVIFIASLLLYPFALLYSGLDMAHIAYNNVPLAITGALGGTVIAFFVALLLTNCPLTRWLSTYGKYSIQVLCWHYLIRLYLRDHFEMPTWQLVLFVAAPFAITYITSKSERFNILFKYPSNPSTINTK